MNEKPWYKRWWSCFAIVLIAMSAFTPQIIDYLYTKSGFPFTVTTFKKEELLSFYGSYLAFLGTVTLGALALWQNFKIDKRNCIQNRLSIRPYLFSYVELENICYLAENDVEYFQLQIELIGKQTNILNKLNKRYILFSYQLANYGNAAAIKIDVLLNNEKFFPLLSISKDNSKTFYFLCDFENVSFNQKIKFEFKFIYYDIKGFGPYIQEEIIYTVKSEKGDLQLSQPGHISEPKKI